MARGILTDEEIQILSQNKYVEDISSHSIKYTYEFKCHFITELQAGKKPTQIFREAGLDPAILGSKRIERATARWKESYSQNGFAGFQHRAAVAKNSKAQKAIVKKQRETILRLRESKDAIISTLEQEKRNIRASKNNVISELRQNNQKIKASKNAVITNLRYSKNEIISDLKQDKRNLRASKNEIISDLKQDKRNLRASKTEAIASLKEQQAIQLANEYAKRIEQLEKLKNEMEAKLLAQQENNKQLEIQVEALKKVGSLEGRRLKGQLLTRKNLCELIKTTAEHYPGIACVKGLCKALNVPRSSYYYYISSQSGRTEKEELDLQALHYIKLAFNSNPYYKKGSRSLKTVLKNKFGIIFNRKRLQRLMRKYNIVCPMKSTNPYKGIWKANKEDRIVPNLLQRRFKPGIPNMVYLTDITYIRYRQGFAYLSIVIDSQTTEPVAYKLSRSLKEDFVLDTLKQLSKLPFANGALIHSDQGVHYTCKAFRTAVKKLGLIQSMSRKGNCLDNALCESFFGHMKQEVKFDENSSFEELQSVIDSYIYFNRYERYQENLKQKTPFEYSRYLQLAA